jgi:tetratricopeptide (TPR) repeat protein
MNERHAYSRKSLIGLVALVILIASGCAGVSSYPVSFARIEANRLNELGLESLRRGNQAAALEAFAEAYRRYAAVEYHPGMVTALVNTARIATGQGRTGIARQALDDALKLLEFTPGLAAEVYFEQSRLLLREGKVADAGPWAERAMAAGTEKHEGTHGQPVGRDPDRGREAGSRGRSSESRSELLGKIG